MLKKVNQINFTSNSIINSIPIQQASVALILRPSRQLTNSGKFFQTIQAQKSISPDTLSCYKDSCSENISNTLQIFENINQHKIMYTPNLSMFEFLLEKRAISKTDVHSGQLCFPGGKCDNDETDYEAVIREAKEEIYYNLNDTKRFIHLGKLPSNAFCYYRKGKKVQISTFLFFQIQPDYTEQDIYLNPGEIANAFWVPFNTLLQKDLMNLQTFTVKSTPPNIYNLSIDKDINEGFISRNHSGVLLQNNEMLWGITLSLLLNIINIMVTQSTEKVFKEQFQNQITFIQKNLIQNAMQFSYNYIPKYEQKAKQLEFFYNNYQQNFIQCLI